MRPSTAAQPGESCLVPSESGHRFLLPRLGDLYITIFVGAVLLSHSRAGTIGDSLRLRMCDPPDP